ncbi:MAG: acyl carrier protein [Lachnospiraceae bacterium]|nr:acyl carrier protein [Lachnospiraceae bacterium]
MNVRETMISILAETMGVDVSTLHEDTVLQEIPDFDSLQFIMLISELDEKYQIEIPLDKALEVKTVGDLINSAALRK